MGSETRDRKGDLGMVRISHEVIGRIAAIAAREVPGVAGVKEGVWPGSGLPWLAGVRVKTHERELHVAVPIVVEYGVNLPRAAIQVQQRVREAVGRMTDIDLVEVEVSIAGVRELKEGRP